MKGKEDGLRGRSRDPASEGSNIYLFSHTWTEGARKMIKKKRKKI